MYDVTIAEHKDGGWVVVGQTDEITFPTAAEALAAVKQGAQERANAQGVDVLRIIWEPRTRIGFAVAKALATINRAPTTHPRTSRQRVARNAPTGADERRHDGTPSEAIRRD